MIAKCKIKQMSIKNQNEELTAVTGISGISNHEGITAPSVKINQGKIIRYMSNKFQRANIQ